MSSSPMVQLLSSVNLEDLLMLKALKSTVTRTVKQNWSDYAFANLPGAAFVHIEQWPG